MPEAPSSDSPYLTSPTSSLPLSESFAFDPLASAPQYPTVPLGSEYPFASKTAKGKEWTWKDEHRKIVISESPYNDLAGPLRPSNIPTAMERAERKMLKIKKRLGIPDVGLVEGLDPCAKRKKDGTWYKRDEIEEQEKILKKKKMAASPKKRKQALEGGSVTSESLSMAASLASSHNTSSIRRSDGRRRGFSVGTTLKKKVNPALKLGLVAKDAETLGETGEVPISQWRNELSKIQLALGPVGGEGAVDGGEYNLTELRR